MESLKEALAAQFEKAISDIRALAEGSNEKMESISQFVEMDYQLKMLRNNNEGGEVRSAMIQRELDSLQAKVQFIKQHVKVASFDNDTPKSID
ncbi:uncharacterized protein LOC111258754 isoform X2 [Varroa jacobsoni]|nr:uncharacterized protein LOC111258754 isoform X2 [Varroa jacobsoni]